jgi:hypothetical protein
MLHITNGRETEIYPATIRPDEEVPGLVCLPDWNQAQHHTASEDKSRCEMWW